MKTKIAGWLLIAAAVITYFAIGAGALGWYALAAAGGSQDPLASTLAVSGILLVCNTFLLILGSAIKNHQSWSFAPGVCTMIVLFTLCIFTLQSGNISRETILLVGLTLFTAYALVSEKDFFIPNRTK